MAWRIDEAILKGEVDFSVKGKVTGTIWLQDREKPVVLDLEGTPWKDLAGHILRFTNPNPQRFDLKEFRSLQTGIAGDITASRKVKVPDIPMSMIGEYYRQKKKWPWHWGNCLYLEWYSEANGRVVIESAQYEFEIEAKGTWSLTEEDSRQQQDRVREAMGTFMQRAGEAVEAGRENSSIEYNDDEPTSSAEAEAEKETARMDQLLDRISARLDREGLDHASDFERVMEEERERLRIERGEPEPEPLTPEQEAERSAWIEEMNDISMEAVEEDAFEKPEPHPLVETAHKIGVRIFHDIKKNSWIPEGASQEHPLYEIEHGVQSASAKLAGALGMSLGDEDWPPDPLIAGDVLVRLKKARNYLRDALLGLDAADDEKLAQPDWRSQIRIEIKGLLDAVNVLIRDARNELQ